MEDQFDPTQQVAVVTWDIRNIHSILSRYCRVKSHEKRTAEEVVSSKTSQHSCLKKLSWYFEIDFAKKVQTRIFRQRKTFEKNDQRNWTSIPRDCEFYDCLLTCTAPTKIFRVSWDSCIIVEFTTYDPYTKHKFIHGSVDLRDWLINSRQSFVIGLKNSQKRSHPLFGTTKHLFKTLPAPSHSVAATVSRLLPGYT